MTTTLADIAVGTVVKLAWNSEPVRLIYKSGTRASIKAVKADETGHYPERDVCPGCECSSGLRVA